MKAKLNKNNKNKIKYEKILLIYIYIYMYVYQENDNRTENKAIITHTYNKYYCIILNSNEINILGTCL